MADGKVVVSVDLDTSKANKELSKLKKEIKATESAISEQEAKKAPLVAQAEKLNQEMRKARAEVQRLGDAWVSGVAGADGQQAKAQARLNQIQSEYDGVVRKIDKIDESLLPAYEKLDRMKEDAGQMQENINKAENNVRKMGKATEKANKKMGVFATRLRGIVLSAFIFNILSKAFRSLTDWMGNIIKNNDEARASIAKLKAALLTMAQPLVDVIVPAFANVVNFLADAATYAAQLVSILFGTTAENASDAAKSLYEEQQAIEGVGAAAQKASGQLASFDQINKLSSEGANGKAEIIMPNFSALNFREIPKWLTDMTITLREILVEWEDLTAEDVLEKVVAGLIAVAGTLIGFSVGGVNGAAIGATVGVSVGALVVSLLFDGEGVINEEELLKSLCAALSIVAGAALGFAIGGPLGAAIGVTVGAGVTAYISNIIFDNDGVVSQEEVVKSACVALGALVGGVIGFVVGGPKGGVMGVMIGATAGLYLSDLLFDNDGTVSSKETLRILCAALGALVGGIIGFSVGGPAGAAIGMTIGATVTIKLSDILYEGFGSLKQIPNFKGFGPDYSWMFKSSSNIPGFASGSVIPPNREFLAVLGDNKTETEVVSPLSTMKQAMIEAMRESGGGGTYTFVVNLDGKEVARNQVKHINDMTRQAGKPVLLY